MMDGGGIMGQIARNGAAGCGADECGADGGGLRVRTWGRRAAEPEGYF